MKRRRFLHRFSAQGAGIALPTFACSGPEVLLAACDTGDRLPGLEAPGLEGDSSTRVAVVGVGGAGGVILAAQQQLPGNPRTLAVNTDIAALQNVGAERSILIRSPSGGKASSPQEANRLARGMKNQIADALVDSHLAIVIAGMGGAAGTGIAPVVAEVLYELGIPSIGVPVLPFAFEGERRMQVALAGKQALEQWVTCSLVVPNQIFCSLADGDMSLSSVTEQVDTLFGQFYRALHQAIALPGLIGIDFEDICYVLGSGRRGRFSCGESALGLQFAAQSALIKQPLLNEALLLQATGLYLAIEGLPSALTMPEINMLMGWIRERVKCENIMFSANVNADPAATYRVSILAVEV